MSIHTHTTDLARVWAAHPDGVNILHYDAAGKYRDPGNWEIDEEGFPTPLWWPKGRTYYDEFDIAQPLAELSGEDRELKFWEIFPDGWFVEANGAFVIHDERSRPLCRVHPSGTVEIVSYFFEVGYVGKHSFNDREIDGISIRNRHPYDTPELRAIILGVVKRLGLEPELRRRRELEAQRRLPKNGGHHRFEGPDARRAA